MTSVDIDIRTLEILKLKDDIPEINIDLFFTRKAKKIEKYFLKEYRYLTAVLKRKNAFYLYIYPYLLLIPEFTLKEIFGIIDQDYQNFEIPVVPGLN